MEEKMFELMTRMYSEFSKRFDEVDQKSENIDKRLQTLESGQEKLEAIIENDIKSDLKALHDGYQLTYEKLTVLEEKVDELAATIEKQDVEIRVIKGGKPIR